MSEISDEDKLIYQLRVHKGLKRLVMKELAQEGIPCKETSKNDPKGDILVINPEDVPRVQEIIKSINSRYNG